MSIKLEHVTGQLQEMADADIYDMVPPNTLARIKAIDPHPVVRVYAIGHEGESHGRVVGMGNKVKRWASTAIRKLHGAVQEGVALFYGHEKDNSHEGRKRIGEVVGKRLIDEGGRLKALVATWLYPQSHDMADDLDVCSVETDFEFTIGPDDNLDVQDVAPVSGIALGSSSQGMVPGFEEAGMVAQMQMFAEKTKEEKTMDIKELKKAIIDLGVGPLDLFGDADIMGLEIVTKAVTKEKHDAEGFGNRWKEKAEKNETELEALKKDSVARSELDKVNSELSQFKARPVAMEVAKELKLSDKETQFLELKIDGFKPSNGDAEKMKEEAKTFVESTKAEFEQTAKLIDPGWTPGPVNAPADDKDKPGGVESQFVPE